MNSKITVNNSYAICTTPRSGSNLLCSLLTRTNQMGNPTEFLNTSGTIIPTAVKRSLFSSSNQLEIEKYFSFWINATTTPNGTFGIKLLYDQLKIAQSFDFTKDILKKGRFVWLLRKDVVAQAVSLFLAEQTGAWKSKEHENAPRSAVQYDGQAIDLRMKKLAEANQKWLEFFSINEIDVFTVFYEDLVAKPQSICTDICNFCGIKENFDFSLDSSDFKKQGDSINEDFAARYRSESEINLNMLSPNEYCFQKYQIISSNLK